MTIPDMLLFVKTQEFQLWLIRHTQRFPKNLRHSYTQRLENLALETTTNYTNNTNGKKSRNSFFFVLFV